MTEKGKGYTPEKSPAIRESIALYAFLGSITGVSLDILLPAYHTIGESFNLFHVTDLQKNILLFIVGMFFGELASGYLCDRYGRKKILLASISIYIVGTLVCLCSWDFSLLMLGRILEGVGAAGQKISVRAMLRDRFSGAQLAKVSSYILIALIFTPFVAPFIGQQITDQMGWRSIFGFLVIFSLSSLGWFLARHPETMNPQHRNINGLRGFGRIFMFFIRQGRCIGYTFIAGLLFGIQISFISLSPLMLKDVYGIEKAFSIYFGAMTCGFGIALFINAKLVNNYGMHKLTAIALILFTLIGTIFTVVAHSGNTPSFPFFFTLMFGMLFSLGLVFGNIIALILEPLGSAAGAGGAFCSSLSTIIALCVSYLIGYFYQGTLTPFAIGVFVCAFVSLATYWIVSQRKSEIFFY